ncbi:hypothetical protein CFP56_012757 [Quercus suber]|uniref:Uncharacterized protein n=1 Tax=Quercus suber TaxID=58331 RepID=A0AAW0KVQ8_QUESU
MNGVIKSVKIKDVMVLVGFWFDKLINDLSICFFFSPLQQIKITFPHIYVLIEFSKGTRLNNSYYRGTDWTPLMD